MKQGWEIKKLGDVCNVLNGLWIGKKEPFINICVIRNTNFTKDCKLNLDNVAYIDAEAKQFASRKLLVGDIIVEKSGGSEKQPVGRVVLFDVAVGDYSFSNFTSALRVKDGVDVIPKYLHRCLYAHYLRGETYKLQSKTTGLHNLDMKGYLRLPIPVPPIAEQEKIVAELDCLSGIIEKKKQQLKELDNLAQSIFYEMFGDPDNSRLPKLPLQNLSEYKLSYGSGASAVEFDEDVRYVRITDIQEDGKLDSNAMSPSVYEEKYLLHDGDILFARSGATVGKTYHYRNTDGKAIYAGYLIRFIPNQKLVLPEYVFYYTRSDYYHAFIRKSAQAVAQPNINAKQYGDLIVCVPPLALQQDFASKIETIEKQKELISQSIKETETLFNSRMDYYFN